MHGLVCNLCNTFLAAHIHCEKVVWEDGGAVVSDGLGYICDVLMVDSRHFTQWHHSDPPLPRQGIFYSRKETFYQEYWVVIWLIHNQWAMPCKLGFKYSVLGIEKYHYTYHFAATNNISRDIATILVLNIFIHTFKI